MTPLHLHFWLSRRCSKPTGADLVLEFVPFDPRHLEKFQPDPAMATPYEQVLDADLYHLMNDDSKSVMQDGIPVACGGLQPIRPGRMVAWAMLSPSLKVRNFSVVDRYVRHVLRGALAAGCIRIETTIDPLYPRARALRWALSLGFRMEGVMRNAAPDGRDMWLVSITGEFNE